ncbi:MAG: right-handed parallel beta-helix repeat-containing protein, partial [Methanomassiliicoccales archaeon]
MNRRKVAILLILAMLLSLVIIIVEVTPPSKADIIYVPTNYPTIQEAINAADPGDTVYVYSGTYNENVVVDKTINLTGENPDTTIIHGENTGPGIDVIADWVNITGFTVIGTSTHTKECIKLYDVQNCSITNNNLSLNSWGIYLELSSNNIVNGNNISTTTGIHLESSDNNNVTNNKLTPISRRWGIYIWYSTNNTLTGNEIAPGGVYILGDQLSHYNSHNIPLNNKINGELLYYYKDESGLNIDDIPVGQIILANCSDMNIKNLEINKTVFGIHIAYSINISIKGNNISDNFAGIVLINSYECDIIGNYVSFAHSGILLLYSSNSNIWGNNVSIQAHGINLDRSSNNSIKDNNVSYCGFGIDPSQSSDNSIEGNIAYRNNWGIRLRECSNNTVKDNNASWNENGILFRESNNNIIKSNNIISSYIKGIIIESSSNNRIYHNNIINNTNQAYDDGDDNFWDDGYPSGGNYWSDLDEASEGAYDDFKGPDQNVLGGDGIVDNGTGAGGGKNPYMIDFDSQDNYPLMESFERRPPPLLPPILYINVSSNGKDIILNWEPQTIQDFDPYLIYRST